MFMQFVGEGVGHKSTDYLQQRPTISTCDELEVPLPNLPDEDIV
jgi:hypothetical protein